jgi:hypothetical protein
MDLHPVIPEAYPQFFIEYHQADIHHLENLVEHMWLNTLSIHCIV